MSEEHTGRLFHLKIHWLMKKGSGDSCPRNASGALLKEQNHDFAERFNVQVDCQILLVDFYTFESVKQLHARKG